jgi:simple sugar transport system ATP-binding protein
MLYRDAEILIFDEPTAVLTPQEIEYLRIIMNELRKKGKTIILITHKLEEIKQIADRCAILRRGKLIEIIKTSEKSTQEMANLMVGRNVSLKLSKNPANFGKTVLEVEHLTVQNEDHFNVVNDVSFQIRAGEIFAIAGVSGNGQVELADAIAGLCAAHNGKISLNGKDITQMSIRKRTESGISYIPEDRQKYGIVLDLPLYENLALKSFYKQLFSVKGILKKEKLLEHAEKLVGQYDVRSGQGTETITRSLSGGNQQKAILAREISLNSDLMIFVQPTRGMDIGAIENIQKIILAERDAGKAILLISLELEDILALADTIGIIFNGKILKTALNEEFTPQEIGEYMMGVKQ